MLLTHVRRVMPGRHWSRFVIGLSIFLFLLPVPAYAFTFLGSWIFRRSQAASPLIIPTAGDFANGGFLDFDMGFVPPDSGGLPASLSTIWATRNFTITNPFEAVTLDQSFVTLFRGADTNVTVRITKLSGNQVPLNLARKDTAGIRYSRLVGGRTRNSVNIGAGDYAVSIRVRYRRNRIGLWDNSLPPVASPFTFTFTGM
jgi:hypothetical protein